MMRRLAQIAVSMVVLTQLFIPGCLCCCRADLMIVSTVRSVDGHREEHTGSAVCVASADGVGSLILTCRHNVALDPRNVWVSDGREGSDWHWCHRVTMSDDPECDLSILETREVYSATPLADGDLPESSAVTVVGLGPHIQGTGERLRFRANLIGEGALLGESGQHVIPGDSGGPVVVAGDDGAAVLGIVYGFDTPEDMHEEITRRRTQLASHRVTTRFISASKIRQVISTQYSQSCPNGMCPLPIRTVRVRPQIQQPMIGIGIPVGPPRIVDTVEPVPDPISIRGPAGPTGPAGPQGPPGIADTSALEARIRALEQRPLRVIVANGGNVIDDEVYAAGEPVVLDVRRLNRSGSGGQ